MLFRSWDALGDLGRLDADGYLYLVDRVADVIDTADSPVHPARVEAVLEAHPAVRSAAVVGRGGTVHAFLDLGADVDRAGGFSDDECQRGPQAGTHGGAPDDVVARVLAWVRDRGHRAPDTAEAVDGPLRDDAGKLRRRALAPGAG